MRSLVLTRSLVVAIGFLPALLPGQGWEQRVRQRWPGPTIRKVTESQLEAWVAALPTADKRAAALAFVDVQWQAHGLPVQAPVRTYLSPSGSGTPTPTAGVDHGVQEGPEPNGDPNAVGGGAPTVMSCGDQGEGAIFPYGDRDWWQLDVAQTQTLIAWTGPGTGATPIDDTMLELRDATGALLTANDDDPQRGHYSALALEIPPGRYFVAVRGYADVRVGSYALDVACAAPGGGGGGRIAEAPEPNSTAARATAHSCGRQGFGVIANPGNDSDWWSFTLSTAAQIVAETGPDGGSPSQDTTLYLRDQGGAQLAYDDDGGNGLYSRIQMQLQPGTYYLDVQSYAGSNPGGYTLDLTCGSGGGGASASFTAAAGGCAGSNGTPALSARTGELPLMGSTFAIDLANLPARAPAFPFLGFSATRTSSGVNLPFDLAPLGAPGCAVEVDPLDIQVLTANAQGQATWYLPIPNDPNLIGRSVRVQAIVVDPAANGLGATTSNRGTAVVGSSL